MTIKNYEIIDTVTTIIKLVTTILLAIVTIFLIIETILVYTNGTGLFSNMPDGSGVSDGYSVVGKSFTGILSIFASFILLILSVATGIATIVGTILCIIYFHRRNKYKTTYDFNLIFKNFLLKSIFNGITTVIVLLFFRQYIIPVIVVTVIEIFLIYCTVNVKQIVKNSMTMYHM